MYYWGKRNLKWSSWQDVLKPNEKGEFIDGVLLVHFVPE
jgi:hypothetical protein